MDDKGFSLIELALALILIGVLAAPLIQQYNLYTMRRLSEQTTLSQGTVARAVKDFVDAYDRYPCPADLSLDENDPLHGVENYTPPVPPATAGVCNAVAGGIFSTTGRDANAAGGGDPILIGGIPYATLNIPVEMSLDGWKRKITYAVSARMADGSITLFDDTQGAISVVDLDGDILVPGTQTYLMASHGENGVGAYTASGNLVQVCPGNGASGREWENCNNDNIFVDVLDNVTQLSNRSLQAGPLYNDDFLYTTVSGLNGLWIYTVANPDNIHNNNPGNVGIRTDDPQEELDVNGDIKTDTIHTLAYCDKTGNCFPSELIGGVDGVVCENDPNQAMTGMASSKAVCDLALPGGVITGICPVGEFAKGVAGGVIQCAPQP